MTVKPPPASSPDAFRRMRSARQRDTGPEIAIRRALHAQGLRFRVNYSVLPGTRRRADIVFPRAKIAVFVDGCFWHFCPIHRTLPKANASWWLAKLRANRSRDADTNRSLRKAGWRVERIWEHESVPVAVARIVDAVRTSGGSAVSSANRQRRSNAG